MKRLRVLAVDDEPLALTRLAHCLAACEGAELVGAAQTAEAALAAVRAAAPDVVLLDIEMPKGDGFEIAAALIGGPHIIFVSAFDHFAVRAFEVNAVDYLLKPVDRDRLADALARVRDRLELREAKDRSEELAAIVAQLRGSRRSESAYETEIWVRERDGRVRIPLAAIERIVAERDYIRLIHPKGSHLHRMKLTDLAGRLDPSRFLRVHRSVIVRRDLVEAIKRSGARPYLVLRTGIEVPIGRKYLRDTVRALTPRAG